MTIWNGFYVSFQIARTLIRIICLCWNNLTIFRIKFYQMQATQIIVLIKFNINGDTIDVNLGKITSFPSCW